MLSSENFEFRKLEWDTDFFGVTCARAVLKNSINAQEWQLLKNQFSNFQFISILNLNSNSNNAIKIGQDTKAFLADVSIQFIKPVKSSDADYSNLIISNNYKRDDKLFKFANFEKSKFLKDPNFKSRGGDKIYNQWLINSFQKENKFFITSNDNNGNPNGFLLYYLNDNYCVIDLIAAAKGGRGVGTKLFNALEDTMHKQKVKQIKVGTQIDNMGAVNFYHKLGFKQIECNQVYHLWNL